jgi:hypothetical protein
MRILDINGSIRKIWGLMTNGTFKSKKLGKIPAL